MTMPVVDASVAVKFVTEEIGSDEAVSLLRSPDPLIAPDWLLAEVGNALWKKVRSGSVSQATAVEALTAMPDFFQELHPSRPLLDRAYELAFAMSHSLYDCLYLELARQQGTVLITADKEFQRAAVRSGHGAQVILMGAGA
jgi:predicted nucleic acid-binding protein